MRTLLLQTQFKHFLQIIGRGQRSGRYLSQSEAREAMGMLLAGQITAEQRGAFLMLLRMREEIPAELAGFLQASRQSVATSWSIVTPSLDIGCYAGKRRHLPWFLLAVLLLAENGRQVFLHGTSEPDSQRLYLEPVLGQLGIPVACNPQQAQQLLHQQSFCYVPLQCLSPALDEVIQLRSQLGLRSCANTLARMLNPCNAEFSYQGVFHRALDQRHSDTALLTQERNVLCLRGEGGETELNPERPVQLHICRQGKQHVLDIPALASHWRTKPRVLDPCELVQVWQGSKVDTYAIDAVTGTLASMLVLTEQLDWQQAMEKAQQLWNSRNTDWPFSSPQLHNVGA